MEFETKQIELEELLTPSQLARIFQVSPATIYAWATRGVIPSIKIQGTIRFSRGEIWNFLQEHKKNCGG